MKKKIFLINTMFIVLLGCSFEDPITTDSTGSLRITVKQDGLEGRIIQPSVSMAIFSFDISGVGYEGQTFSQTNISENIFLKEDLSVGNWIITVNAKNIEGVIIASGSTEVTIEKGQTAIATIIVTSLSGKGSLNVTVKKNGDILTASITRLNTMHIKEVSINSKLFGVVGYYLYAIFDDFYIKGVPAP